MPNYPCYCQNEPFIASLESLLSAFREIKIAPQDSLFIGEKQIVKEKASEDGYPKATTLHILKEGLIEADKFMDALNNEEVDLETAILPKFSGVLRQIHPDILSDEEMRKQVQPVIRNILMLPQS